MYSNGKGVWGISSGLFLLSGFTGLAYEIIWFKRFSHVWGSSTLAMASVVGSFLFGLGIGAHLLGRLADRIQRPLLWYGFCECFIGILAFAIPFEIQWVLQSSEALHPVLELHQAFSYLLRFLLTFLIIGPPCLLMGGTLPLVISQFTQRTSPLKETTGWFYGINTIGAATGCYVTGFHLLPSIGLAWSNGVVALLNIAIGLLAAALSRRAAGKAFLQQTSHPVTTEQMPEGKEDHVYASSTRALYWAVGITGCAALILEMVWSRQLALILGGSTYAFTAMLFVVLVGIGLGSLVFRLWISRLADHGYTIAGAILILAVGTAIGRWVIPYLTIATGLLRPFRSSQLLNGLTCVAASAALELLPSVSMGILFPYFVHLTRKTARDAGRAVGSIYAFNTLGTICGALLTSFLIIAYLGTAKARALALLLYLAAMVMFLPAGGFRTKVRGFVCFLIMAGSVFYAARRYDPRITDMGVYLYGPDLPSHGGKLEGRKGNTVLYFREGSSCNVLVTERGGTRSLRVNGKVDASTGGDMPMQLGLAYFPRFLLPEAQRALVIGYGSGTTCGASLLFPDTEVTCCEIEPAVYAASKYFSDVNHSPQDSPRFSIVLDDGRNHLQATETRYDLILSEPSNPWMAGISNLFTREFYEGAKHKLTEKGILAQWIQTYSLSPSDYLMIVRTVMSVFSHSALIQVSKGDTILLAGQHPFTVPKETVSAAQSFVSDIPAIGSDLEKHFGTTDVRSLLLTHLVLDESGLRRMLGEDGSEVINTDLNLRLEFDAPIHLFAEDAAMQAETQRKIVSSMDPLWVMGNFRRWECTKDQLEALKEIAARFLSDGEEAEGRQIIDLALEVSKDEAFFIAERLRLEAGEDQVVFGQEIRELVALSGEEANRLGVSMFQSKEYAKAAPIFEEIVAANPTWATAWANLALCYREIGEKGKGEEACAKAMSLDPLNGSVREANRAFKTEPSAAEAGTSVEEGALEH